MYHRISIAQLSPTAASRLRNGHRVRVKAGRGQEIHVSEEQLRKIMKAHEKGVGCIIQFDPCQVMQHKAAHKGKRTGRGVPLADQEFTGNDVAHFFGAKHSSEPLMDKKVSLKDVKDVGKRAKHFFGLGVRKGKKHSSGGEIGHDVNHFFKHTLPSKLIHKGIPAAASFLGGVASSEFGGLGAIPAGIAGEDIAQYVGKKTGYGVPHRRGMGVHEKKDGCGLKRRKTPKAKAHKKTPKRRVRRGRALVAAGY